MVFFGLALAWIIHRREFFPGKISGLAKGKSIRICMNSIHSATTFLFIYLVGLIVGLLDRWLLQVCNGSIEQGLL